MNFTEAFRAFGAQLGNPQNQTMAIAEDGSIVMSLWGHLFDVKARTITDHTDRYSLSAWTHSMVAEAFENRRPVRIVRPDYMGPLPENRSHAGLAKGYTPLTHLVGEIVSFEPETEGKFVIKYKPAPVAKK